MDLWIQPCARCPDLYGKSAAESAHQDLTLTGVGAVKMSEWKEHYTCVRCRAGVCANSCRAAEAADLDAVETPASIKRNARA